MKIIFRLVKGNSGVDIWTLNLAGALRKLGVNAEVQFYPHNLQYMPFAIKAPRRREKDAIIHTNTWNGFAFKEEGLPLITTEHLMVAGPGHYYRNALQQLFYKIIYRYEKNTFKVADAITSVSDYTRNSLKKIFGYDSIRIYNGIDEAIYCPKAADIDLKGFGKKSIRLLFVGNMSRRKGADLLPDIMKKLGNKFALICCGSNRMSVRKAKNIYFTGFVTESELSAIYNYAHIFLFPTRLEGFGLSVAEAMACAKPVVSTNCSSIPELIIDKKGGFLCEVDNIEEIVEKIRILAADSSLRKEMGRFNRERVERHFTLKQMAENYLKLYQEVLTRVTD